MKNENPLVSAIIPTKDRAALLQRALQSVLSQSYAPIEIVVVDDGSTDGTEKLVHGVQKEHDILHLRNNDSKGAAKARNQAIEKASGLFIAGLDDDDEWHPQRIEKLVKAYDDVFACVTSNVKMQYKNGSAVWHKKSIIKLDKLLLSNQVGNQVLVERKRLLKVGGFDESLASAQDYDLWIRLCDAYGPVKNVQEPLQVIHNEHQQERISNPLSQLQGYLAFYQKHKHRMNRKQRKYQLYNIRRAQGKSFGLFDIPGWVPPERYAKETKRWFAERFLNI